MFYRVVTCYDWASSDAVASLLSAEVFWMYEGVYMNVMNLHLLSHTSLLASRLSEKWP